jgi:hypothetical protein
MTYTDIYTIPVDGNSTFYAKEAASEAQRIDEAFGKLKDEPP